MPGWQIEFSVEKGKNLPVFLQLARSVSADIRRGRLAAGQRLPGSRRLAEQLGLHRNTVLAAYQELAAEGWIETAEARGTFVSKELPDPAANAARKSTARSSEKIAYDLPPARAPFHFEPLPPGTLALLGGMPDVRLVPSAMLARAYRRALAQHGKILLSYGDERGHVRLRRALAEMLTATRGLALDEDNLLITRGSQMALDLVARALLRPGDRVAVEGLGYRPAWQALENSGAKLVPIPLDEHGLDVAALRKQCDKARVFAVYVTPHHQYPTTVPLSPGRRIELLELARTRRMLIIEDDYDHEFHYGGRPILPLASTDTAGAVVYIGTLSKVLAPGLRIGYVVAPEAVLERVATCRMYVDRQGDAAVECAVAELLEESEVQRHVRRAQRIYLARRSALASALARELRGVVSFDVPNGGIAFWVKVAPGIDVDAWAERALRHGVAFQPGSRFTFDGRSASFARLGFAALCPEEIEEAVRRLRKAL